MHTTSISKSSYIEYLEKEATERAYWQGKAAEKLELAGELVTRQNFRHLASGVEPIYGEVLRVRERHSLSRNGKQFAWPVALYDSTIFAPKSVSAVGVVDDRISPAHQETVREILPVLDALAYVKRDRHLERSGNAIYAAFHHQVNRALDPHEHTHIAVMNLSFDAERGTWRAFAAYALYQSGTRVQDLYRERLAERISSLGYQLGEDGREIEGISPELVHKFSEREKHLAHIRELFRRDHGAYPTKNEMNILVRHNRPDKMYLPKEEIRERQLARLTPSERLQLTGAHQQAREREYVRFRDVTPAVEREKVKGRPGAFPAIQDHVESEPGLSVRLWSY